MNTQELEDYLYSYTNKYEHADLSRMEDLMHRLGDPQKRLKFVHVAGTNGKGSCCAMTASILRHAGYRTGLYTSPHIIRFSERIQVNGENIPDRDLERLALRVRGVIDGMQEKVNWFEMVTAIGLLWFEEQKCDIVVFEVGLGGTLDGTNIIEAPECSVIMNIGLDHTEILGNTLEEIAVNKAGIIKKGCPTVIYRGVPSVEKVFEDTCAEKHSEMTRADFSSIRLIRSDLDGQRFDAEGMKELFIPLAGGHQLRNACVVINVIRILTDKGWKITENDIREGLKDVTWPVRFQVVSKDPVFIIDGGHNPQCTEAVAAGLDSLIGKNTHIVILTGILADKDSSNMIDNLSRISSDFVTVTPPSFRAMSSEKLGEMIRSKGFQAVCCSTIEEGISTAMHKAKESDGAVCCVGSLYVAGAVLSHFQNR